MKPIQKHWREFTPQDFEISPVWVLTHKLCDKEIFQPWRDQLPFEDVRGINNIVVKATLTFADGSTFPGYIQPTVTSKYPSMRPAIFSPIGGQIDFWLWRAEPEGKPAAFYAVFNKTAKQIFPIRFSAHPGLTSLPANGEIAGFYGYTDWAAKTLNVTT